VKAVTFTGKNPGTNGTDGKWRKHFYEESKEETMTD
jgi:hypothetical protein